MYIYVHICYIYIYIMQGYCVGAIIRYNGNKITHLTVTIFQLSHYLLSSYIVKLKIEIYIKQ